MSLLSRDQILSADDLQTKDVWVKPWGGHVRIRTMTAHERDNFEQRMFAGKGGKKNRMEDIRATLVSLTVVDEEDKLIFSEKDVKALSKKSAAALDVIFSATQELNAVTDDDVQDMTKNFEGTLDDSSDGA